MHLGSEPISRDTISTYSIHPPSFSTLEMEQDGKVTTRIKLLNEEWNLELSFQRCHGCGGMREREREKAHVTVSFKAADRRSFSLREIWSVNVCNSFPQSLLSEQLYPPTSQSQDLLSHLKSMEKQSEAYPLISTLWSMMVFVWAATWIIGHWQKLVRWLWGSWMYMSERETYDDN